MAWGAVAAVVVAVVAVSTSLLFGGGRDRGGNGTAEESASSAVAATLVQRENSRRGTPGWQIPAGAGTVITGFASETSVLPGQVVHLHVAAPPGSRYRILVYRLGWYGGVGGRLLLCVPGCRSSHDATAQPPPTTPNAVSGLFKAPWSVTDRVLIPADAVSGYYEAKLEIVAGQGIGDVGAVPLVVRQSPTARSSAVLVQVPVNTWEAYNPWGGKSLYQFNTNRHAFEVSFDRPFDLRVFNETFTKLELPWVHFLEREGIDVAYQSDVDTDRDPNSLLEHRLVFTIGHDEYWTQRMRTGFDHALALSTNLMFGSNTGEWRMRYASDRRTIVEWRDPAVDPVHNRQLQNGFFRAFGEPECKLMGVQHEWAAQRDLSVPPTAYAVSGPTSDPWLDAAGIASRQVIPGVVGYEWDTLIPGCFVGKVVRLMTAVLPGSDGIRHSADMVRATAPSGGRVFAMGTMELGWAFDSPDGRPADRRVSALVEAALRDLTRPAPPVTLIMRRRPTGLSVVARLSARDPRILRVSVRVVGGAGCDDSYVTACRLPLPRGTVTYTATAIDKWGVSTPLSVTVRSAPSYEPGVDVRGARVAAA